MKSAALTRTERLARYAAAVGVVLALVCGSLPDRYRDACHALAQLCSLGAGGH